MGRAGKGSSHLFPPPGLHLQSHLQNFPESLPEGSTQQPTHTCIESFKPFLKFQGPSGCVQLSRRHREHFYDRISAAQVSAAFQLTKSESWTLEARPWRSGFIVAVPLAPPRLCTHVCNGQDTGLAAGTNIFPQTPAPQSGLNMMGVSFYLML